VRRVIKDAAYILAGLAGVVCILWLVASSVFGVSIVIFQTGSMAPTMPTGTAAVVLPVDASELAVGDVVTVPTPGKVLPVTHRVVSVTPDPLTPGGSILELKGDANDTQDQQAYQVSEVRRVLFALPGAGYALVFMRTPLFLGMATVIVASLVVVAFWPRPRAAHRAESPETSRELEAVR